MEFLNKVEIRGVVGQVHITKVADTETAQFSVLTEDVSRSKDGCAVVNCTWFSVRAWKGPGIVDLQRIEKGSHVHVIGRFRCQRYVGTDNCEKTCYEVVASTVELMEG